MSTWQQLRDESKGRGLFPSRAAPELTVCDVRADCRRPASVILTCSFCFNTHAVCAELCFENQVCACHNFVCAACALPCADCGRPTCHRCARNCVVCALDDPSKRFCSRCTSKCLGCQTHYCHDRLHRAIKPHVWRPSLELFLTAHVCGMFLRAPQPVRVRDPNVPLNRVPPEGDEDFADRCPGHGAGLDDCFFEYLTDSARARVERFRTHCFQASERTLLRDRLPCCIRALRPEPPAPAGVPLVHRLAGNLLAPEGISRRVLMQNAARSKSGPARPAPIKRPAPEDEDEDEDAEDQSTVFYQEEEEEREVTPRTPACRPRPKVAPGAPKVPKKTRARR